MEEMKANKIRVADWHKNVKVYFITGQSGVGKSKWVHDKMVELGIEEFEEIKYSNGFWNGIAEGTGCAVYDDFRDSHLPASEFINLIDYNVHNMNVKGAAKKNRYTTIFITSIQDPEQLY